jgi:MFS family permease
MVGREDLMNAISLNSAQFNAARVVGPGIAGLLIAVLGIPPLFLLNAISYIAVLAGLALMDPTGLHAPAGARAAARPLRQIRDGVAFAWRTPPIRLALLMIFAVSTFGMNFNIILPLLAERTYRTGATGYGVMSSLLGVGSLIAALVLAGTVKRPRVGVLVVSAGVFSVLEIALAQARSPGAAYAALALIGFATIAFAATANTLLQTNAPDAMRGRVMALYSMLFAGSTPIGALAIGALASRLGAPGALFVGALPCLVAALYGASVWRKTAAYRAPTPEMDTGAGPDSGVAVGSTRMLPPPVPAIRPAPTATAARRA